MTQPASRRIGIERERETGDEIETNTAAAVTQPKDVAHDDTEMIETSNLDDEAAPLDEATAVEDEDKTHDQLFYFWGNRRRRTPSPKPPTPPATYQHPLGPQPGESFFTVFDFATTTTEIQPATAPDQRTTKAAHRPRSTQSSLNSP